MSALRLFWAKICPAFLRILSFPISGLPLGVEFEQSPLGDQQIRQTEEDVKLRRVLGRSRSENSLASSSAYQLSIRRFSQTQHHFDPSVCE